MIPWIDLSGKINLSWKQFGQRKAKYQPMLVLNPASMSNRARASVFLQIAILSSATVNNLNDSIVSYINDSQSKRFTSQLKLPVFGHNVLQRLNISFIILGLQVLSGFWMGFIYVTSWKETDFWRYLQTSLLLLSGGFVSTWCISS